MISSLHLQHFSQYPSSSQQCSLLHHSNIVIRSFSLHPQILLWHFQGLLSLQEPHLLFSVSTIFQSLSLSPGTFPLLPFLFTYSYINWYSNIDDYPLSLFLINSNYVWSSCLYYVVTLNIDIPQHFHFFIFCCSFRDVFIPFLVCSNLFFLQRSQRTFFATLSCCLL